MVMRFAVDAHAIGQHLTGNETYIRNLLYCFAALDRDADFITYVSREDAFDDMPRQLRRDQPDILHVQYTAPLFCGVPLVVSVHDVSFLEHPEYFTAFRSV